MVALGLFPPRAVDEDVAGAQVLQHLPVDGLQGLRLQHVGLVALAGEALGLALIGQLLHRLLVQVQGGHLGPRLGESSGHGAAQHAARAGDDNHLAGKINIQGQIHHI